MDTLAKTLHTDQEWQAWHTAQNFASALAELKIGNIRITGHVGKAIQ